MTAPSPHYESVSTSNNKVQLAAPALLPNALHRMSFESASSSSGADQETKEGIHGSHECEPGTQLPQCRMLDEIPDDDADPSSRSLLVQTPSQLHPLLPSHTRHMPRRPTSLSAVSRASTSSPASTGSLPPLPYLQHESKLESVEECSDPPSSSLLEWKWEILSWIFSAALMVAMSAILMRYDGTAVLRWTFLVNLNALLSILATVLLMTLRFQIPVCISQLKWNHFAQRRPLIDMELHDHASRSALGSAELLLKRPTRALATLGALLTISIITIGPFVQQLVSQQVLERDHTDVAAPPTLPILNWTSQASTQNLSNSLMFDMEELNPRMLQLGNAVRLGSWAEDPQEYFVKPACVNLNCTWISYWTLIVGSECRNVTEKANVEWEIPETHAANVTEAKYWNTTWYSKQPIIRSISLPNGQQLYHLLTDQIMADGLLLYGNYSIGTRFPSLAFQDKGNVLMDLFILGTEISETQESSYFAYECMFQLQAQNFRATSNNGIFEETPLGPPISNNSYEAQIKSPWRWGMNTSGGQVDDLIEIVTPDGAKLSLPVFKLLIVPKTLELVYDMPSYANISDESKSLWDGGIMRFLPLLTQVNVDGAVRERRSDITLEQRMANVAGSLTQTLRSGSSFFDNDIYVEGRAYTNTIIYVVTWPWIALPAALVLLTLVLLIATIIDTSRKGLQKHGDSAIALLALGRDEAVVRALDEANGDLNAALKISKNLTVRIEKGRSLRSTSLPDVGITTHRE